METKQLNLFNDGELIEFKPKQVEIDEEGAKSETAPMTQRKKQEKTLNFLKIVPDDFVNLNRVRFTYKYGKTQVTLLKSFDAENLSYLWHVPRLDAVTLDGALVSADTLNKLAPLNLRYLKVYTGNCTGEDLAVLENWKALRYLNLHCGDKITDKGLAYLQNLKQLTHLYVYCSYGRKTVTDRGLVSLTFLPQLEKLCILGHWNYYITGEDWEKTGQATELREFAMSANWTDAGIDKLVKWLDRLPKLENLMIRTHDFDNPLPNDGLLLLEGLLGEPTKCESHTVKWEYIQLRARILEYMEQVQKPVCRDCMIEKFGKDEHFQRASEILIQKGILEQFYGLESEESEYPTQLYRLTSSAEPEFWNCDDLTDTHLPFLASTEIPF